LIFDRLAKFVIKRYVLVILAWIVVIFYAFPLILNVNDVIEYQETEFIGDITVESQLAAELKARQFPVDSANSSMLIIIVGEDMLSNTSRDFTLTLEDSIRTEDDLSYLGDITSIYDIYSLTIQSMVESLAPAMHEMESQTNLSLQMLFGIPDGYFMTFEGINSTAFIVYGIPWMYLGNWDNLSATLSGQQLDEAANSTTIADLADLINDQNIDDANATLMMGYYLVFYGFWANISEPNPYDRLNMSVDGAAQLFIDQSPPSYANIISAVYENLSIYNYNYPLNQSDLASSIMAYTMSSQFEDPVSSEIAISVLFLTNVTWKGSFSQPNLNLTERIDYVFPLIQQSIIESVSEIIENVSMDLPIDGDEFISLLNSLVSNFTLTDYSDHDKIRQFSIFITGAGANIQNAIFLQSIYDFGLMPDPTDIGNYSWNLIRSEAVENYPVELPPGVLESFVSEDNSTILLIVTFTKEAGYQEANGDEPIVNNVEIIRDLSASIDGAYDSLTVYVTGEAPISADMSEMTTKDLELIEPATIILVLVLLSVFFRSILTPFVPLTAIGIALGISQAAVFLIGTLVAHVHFTVLTLLVTILFGVGTDYSIFILARYREERLKGANKEDAMQTSVTWAGESITTSGATVIIAFGSISISTFSMFRTMGLILGLAVLIALLVALTLVPAITLLLGKKIFWPTSGKRWTEFRLRYLKWRAQKRGGYFRHAAKFAVKYPWPIIGAALLISVPTTYIYMTGETSYDFIGGMGDTESVDGLNAMSESFGAGRISPTEVLIRFEQPVLLPNGSFDYSALDTINDVSIQFSELENVHEVESPTMPDGEPISYMNISDLPELERYLLTERMTAMIGQDNRTVLIEVVFNEEPFTSQSLSSVEEIRALMVELGESEVLLESATMLVGGQSAGMVDVDEITSSEFAKMEIIVIVGVFLVLLIVLGSVLLPLFAILTIALSISWTLATTMLIFDMILHQPVLWLVPFIIFVILMGLGMDYNIFILTRIREEMQKRGDHVEAIVEAVDRTGGIITACAVIMAGAFGTMMLSSTSILQEFGFALSFAVLLDAMLVRTYVTPAIIKILGPKWTWWAPGRLQRVKPIHWQKADQDAAIDDL